MNKKDKKIESNESYDKMADSLDSTFEGETEVDKQIERSEKTSELLAKVDLLAVSLEDAKYMAKETKSNIEGLNKVLEILEKEIKVGAKPRMFEVYATLSNSKTTAMKELRELKKIILDHQDKKKDGDGKGKPNNVTVNNYMTPKNMMKMMDNARKVNTMKQVDATFDVKEEKNGR